MKEDQAIKDKQKYGKQLLETLMKQSNNDVEKLYSIFEKTFPNFSIYGDTKEKALLNYCTYKSDMVEKAFSK